MKLTMKCLAMAIFLCVESGWTAPQKPLVVSGSLLSVKAHTLEIQTASRACYRIHLTPKTQLVSEAATPFFLSWLLPGDHLTALLEKNGVAAQVQVHVVFFSGTLAFSTPIPDFSLGKIPPDAPKRNFPDRITLLEGEQFFLNSTTPVYLNGETVGDVTKLKPGANVLIRFNPDRLEPTGVWFFDFSKPPGSPQNIFKVQFSTFTSSTKKPFLKITTQARANGKLSARLLGVFQDITLKEGSAGNYEGIIRIPQDLILQGSYLELHWVPANANNETEETILERGLVSIHTKAPTIWQVAPEEKSKISVNPPYIFAQLNPDGTQLELDTMHFFLDGKDRTQKTFREPGFLFFLPEKPLSAGEHSCTVMGKSEDGYIPFRKSWRFFVQREDLASPEK